MVDLIEDESEKGAVVKVTLEDGVEYLNYNDVSICTIVNVLNRPRRNILPRILSSGYVKFPDR